MKTKQYNLIELKSINNNFVKSSYYSIIDIKPRKKNNFLIITHYNLINSDTSESLLNVLNKFRFNDDDYIIKNIITNYNNKGIIMIELTKYTKKKEYINNDTINILTLLKQ